MHAEDEAFEPGAAQLAARLGLPAVTPHLRRALVHPSFRHERPDAGGDNQRLEFLGDAVVGLCISELLMAAFQAVDEGQLTVMRAALVNARALARAAEAIDLSAALRLGRGADQSGERKRTNVLADAMEAVIGAVYLDHGLDAARDLTRRVLGRQFTEVLAQGGTERDAKSRLQEIAQARGYSNPRYQITGVDGPPHARSFTVEVTVGAPPPSAAGPPPERSSPERSGGTADAAAQPAPRPEASRLVASGCGRGKSRKQAEQQAAQVALTVIERSDIREPKAEPD